MASNEHHANELMHQAAQRLACQGWTAGRFAFAPSTRKAAPKRGFLARLLGR